jgi:hypothetical protein
MGIILEIVHHLEFFFFFSNTAFKKLDEHFALSLPVMEK